ncbi:MAG: hypothetical protein IGS03_00160 [Candidatus Sericytochromatia bacterium]|nr:hypothetical protein [Candidatus Sericytochromatia bacterium]
MPRPLGALLLTLLTLSTPLVACSPPAPPVAEDQRAESNTPLQRLQLTTAQLQAGQQTFESFVIQASGQVHWAQWNSDGVLLAAAQGQDASAFTELQRHPIWQAPPESPADDVLGRPAFYAELARMQDQRTELRSLEALDTSLSDLSARLHNSLQPLNLTAGFYLWLTPQPQGGDLPRDLDLNQPAAEGQAIASALKQGLQQGQVVVPVADGAYFQGERALRQAFVAQGTGVGLQFGLLRWAEGDSGR